MNKYTYLKKIKPWIKNIVIKIENAMVDLNRKWDIAKKKKKRISKLEDKPKEMK